MGDMSFFMNLIIMFCGAYILYAAVLLKTTGEIKKNILISSNVDLRKCKDLEGFKKFLFPRAAGLGAMTLVYGLGSIINDYVVSLGIFYLLFLLLPVATLIWYMVTYRRGLKRFWDHI